MSIRINKTQSIACKSIINPIFLISFLILTNLSLVNSNLIDDILTKGNILLEKCRENIENFQNSIEALLNDYEIDNVMYKYIDIDNLSNIYDEIIKSNLTISFVEINQRLKIIYNTMRNSLKHNIDFIRQVMEGNCIEKKKEVIEKINIDYTRRVGYLNQFVKSVVALYSEKYYEMIVVHSEFNKKERNLFKNNICDVFDWILEGR